MGGKEKSIFLTSLDPIKIMQIFNADDYERMIEDWRGDYLTDKYERVEKLGGPGDKGRDILCTGTDGSSYIYQCKHYDRKLGKTDILLEIGKCCYYCSDGAYNTPKKYYFVSPQGVTTQVRDLLASPSDLKKELKIRWETTCQSKITSQREIKLEGDLLSFIDRLDFSIFNYISPEEFLADFKGKPKYTTWFGKLVKPRKLIVVPEEIKENESTYIKKLLEAYSEHLAVNIEDAKKLKETDSELWENFNYQRLYFYSAEYLAAYSRETYPPDQYFFEQLKEEFYHGIIDAVQEDAKNGFERLKKVLQLAASLNPSQNNPLSSEVDIKDRKGVVHHLANERGDIKWKR